MSIWEWVLWVHLLAMAFFVGGQLFLVVAVVPVERRAPDRERLRQIARRFGNASLVAIAVLLATGAAMATEFHDWSSAKLQVKLGLVVVVAVLIVWHARRPEMHALEALVFLGSLAIVWLGVWLANG